LIAECQIVEGSDAEVRVEEKRLIEGRYAEESRRMVAKIR
jgi:hypothetical protein